MTQEDKAKAYDEALERARKMLNMILDNELLGFPDQIREIFPQLRESNDERIREELIEYHKRQFENNRDQEVGLFHKDAIAYLEKQKEQKPGEDEKIRKELIEFIQWSEDRGMTRHDFHQAKRPAEWIAYLEKQKENIEKEYVFRPLAGTDITIAAEQAIRKANEGDRLVLAFNGAYIPVRKGCNANKIVDIYDAFIEKQKDASKAIEAVDRIDKYIDEHLANAHDMKDSNPDKKYYRGWDDALGEMAKILQDVYSEEKQKDLTTENIYKHSRERMSFYNEQQKEQKPVDLSEMMVHKEPYIAPVPTPIVADEQKPDWSDEDKEALDMCLDAIPKRWKTKSGILLTKWLKDNIHLQLKQEWSEEDKDKVAQYLHERDGGMLWSRAKDITDDILDILRPQKLDASKLENFDPVDVLNKIKTEWPMAWEKVVGKQEWSEEDEKKITFLERLIRYNVPEGQYGWADGHKSGFITKSEAISKLKSLRPQPQKIVEFEPEEGDIVTNNDGVIAVFENWGHHPDGGSFNDKSYFFALCTLDDNYYNEVDCHPQSNGLRYAKPEEIRKLVPYLLASPQPSWKPSEHQMTILKAVKDYVGVGSGYWGEALGSLIDDLEKL